MHNWWNDYITIPYKKMGRDKDGLDCWGLVRMIYKDQFDIDLPSYVDQYNADDTHNTLAELIAISKESWTKTDNPVIGDVLLLRAEGSLSHVGVVISPTHFIHVIEDINVTIERYDQGKWKNRLEGAYRYDSNLDTGDVSIVACPNPLKNVRIDGHVPANSSINEIVEYIKKEYANDVNVESNVVIMINGVPVPQDQWDMKPKDGDMIQYRAVAGKGAFRMLLTIAVVVIASIYAPYLVPQGLTGVAAKAALAVATAAISIVGTMLINAIFPIRPPENKDAGTANAQNLLQGGSNQANPYGAIPVVLGKIRFTAPLGAQIYAESNTDTSYLRLLLVWGYGGLQVSDMRIGATDINTLEELEIETLSGIDDPLVSKDRFNTIYPNDVEQQIINTQLPAELTNRVISSISRTSNVVTVVTTLAHTYIADRNVTIAGVTGFNGTYLVIEITNATTFKYAQTAANATGTVSGSSTTSQIVNPWVERTINELCTSVNVILQFAEGLRQIQQEGKGAGNIKALPFTADVQVRQVDPNTLAPLEAWGNVQTVFKNQSANLDSAYYGSAAGSNYLNNIPTPVYQWTSFILDQFNKLILRKGAYTDNPANDPSGNILEKLKRDTRNLNTTYSRFATIQAGETEIWRVCMYGAKVFSTTDLRASIVGSYSGLALTTRTNTNTGYMDASPVQTTATLAAGSISLTGRDTTVLIGASGQSFFKRKDAFSYNVLFRVPYGKYQVRIKRNTSTIDEVVIGGDKHHNFHSCQLTAITAFGNTKPVVEPKPLAMSAIRVKATDQFNGSLEGISATVQSICLDWDSATSTWVMRATRNPASLFRYVLQHPANAKAIVDSKIDLNALIEWHAYCDTNKFTFDSVITNARSLLDVLKDICAAGRSSPTLRDGVWTVITDKVRTTTSQFFTPHNSWGFESVKTLPTIPHAFRIPFINSEQGFQPDEYIVYNDGYNATNATLYEEVSFNGVTTREAIHKHARFHFAQIKLRPETYTLNADIEHLVCTRGDLVKVSHDVPMWGVGTGRIKSLITSTQIELDEPVPMVANIGYTIRIRLADGTNVVRNVSAKLADGYYTIIDLATSVTSLEAEAGNLFMFGALDSETVDLIVQSIEPISNLTARITLVDYSPAVYDSDSETIPEFTSKITLPPTLLQQKIYVAPTIGTIVSDESVMVVLAPKTYMYRIKVTFTNPATLPFIAKYVEGQIDYAGDTSIIWQTTKTVPIRDGCIYFDDVQEASVYSMRLRYVTEDGRAGEWAYTADHTVIGKTTVPSDVTGLTATVSGSKLLLQWDDNQEPDIYGYEVRGTNAGWGTAGYLYLGVSSECLIDVGTYGVAEDYFVKAIDVINLYSVAASSVIFTPSAVTPVSALNYAFRSSSLTTTDLILSWTDVTTQFGLDYYIISYNSTTINARTSTITLNVDWTGAKVFSIVAVDKNGIQSASTSVTVTKVAPAAPPSASSPTVVSDLLMLNWSPSVRTTLPIAGYEVRTADSNWGTAGYLFRGNALNFAVTPALGANTWYIKSFDTDNQYSTAALSTSYTRVIPVAPTAASPAYVFSDNLTNATVTLDWSDVSPIFGLNQYKISYGAEVVYSKSSTITVPADWLGDQIFSIQTIDQLGGTSTALTITVPKLAPNSASGLRTQVIDNNVLLYWTLPAKTTLPIQDVQLRKGAIYATAEVIGFKNGTFTSIQELSAGNYTYWVAVRDTDNRFSTPVSVTSQVAQPPDFVFNAQYFSTFSGTKTSAINEQGGVLLPVNTAETWTEHFTRNGLTYSQDFTNAAWAKTNLTATANSITAPDGTLTADTLSATAAGATLCLQTVAGIGSATGNTYSIYAKKLTSATIGNSFVLRNGTTSTNISALTINYDTGVISQSVGTGAYSINAGNGWWRIVMSVTTGVSNGDTLMTYAGFTGGISVISDGAYFWGAQLEPISTVRPYIATTTPAAIWADPAAQIAAGYPIFIQPNNGTGSYVEVFDYGTILGSSQITLNFQGTVIAATPTISFDIGISTDGITYTTTVGAQSIFATNFRYVKITANVTTTSATGLYLLQSMNVLLNAKLITDAGTVDALSTDASGTIVNFSKEFVDVISITISPNGSTLLTPVYDFKDSVLTGTYSVTSNVVTVSVTAHGLIAGQKVRLNFSSGTAPNGVYTVATLVNANQYTVNLTTANTSGNISTYPESFRVYLFNSAGVRTSGSVSWNVRGY